MTESTLRGSCQCGAVTYQATAAPLFSLACHCRECQKLSASAYSTTLSFRAGDLVVRGELASFERTADSGRRVMSYFCPGCGNRIYHADPDAPGLMRLKSGTLDSAPIPAPRAHVWVSRKQPWVTIADGVPTFAEGAPPEVMKALMRSG